MTIGPLQLVLVKFADDQHMRQISEEIKAARRSGAIRVVDLMIVHKDANGVLQEKKFSDLAEAQKAEYGLLLRGLLGMRTAYKTAGEVDQVAAAMSLSPGDFGISSAQVPQIVENLPNGGSAILAMIEHIWALKLKEALLNAGGELIAQGMLSPEALALGGTTLDDAMAAAQKIEAEAGQSAAAQVAEADQKLEQAKAEAAAKLAEAQRVLDDADAQVAERMEQAKLVAAAAIAASVRTAAQEMDEADRAGRADPPGCRSRARAEQAGNGRYEGAEPARCRRHRRVGRQAGLRSGAVRQADRPADHRPGHPDRRRDQGRRSDRSADDPAGSPAGAPRSHPPGRRYAGLGFADPAGRRRRILRPPDGLHLQRCRVIRHLKFCLHRAAPGSRNRRYGRSTEKIVRPAKSTAGLVFLKNTSGV